MQLKLLQRAMLTFGLTVMISNSVYADPASDTILLQIEGNTKATSASVMSQPTLLSAIKTNLDGILQDVESLPSALQVLVESAIALYWKDDTDTTAQAQENFSTLGKLVNYDLDKQFSVLPQLNRTLIGPDNTAPLNANDLVYSSVVGVPFFAKDPRLASNPNLDIPLNYIQNASGITIKHTLPQLNWKGESDNVLAYQNYYNTITSVESFNAYVLAQNYADGNQFNTLQKTLVTQATDGDKWFVKVGSERIGVVLRQILLYQSQTFVLMTQLIQTQKQMAAAQAMTNALLIANNYMNEAQMVCAAKGIRCQIS